MVTESNGSVVSLLKYIGDGALAEKLGTALQKLLDGSVTRTRLHNYMTEKDLAGCVIFNEKREVSGKSFSKFKLRCKLFIVYPLSPLKVVSREYLETI